MARSQDLPSTNSWVAGKASGFRGDLCLVRNIASRLGQSLTTTSTTHEMASKELVGNGISAVCCGRQRGPFVLVGTKRLLCGRGRRFGRLQARRNDEAIKKGRDEQVTMMPKREEGYGRQDMREDSSMGEISGGLERKKKEVDNGLGRER